MKHNKPLLFGITLLVLFILSGCGFNPEQAQKHGLTIYTSIYPIEYAVNQIGGKTVQAKSIYPPGVDAHSYEPTAKEMTAIAKSDAFFYLGAGMEAFAETTANALNSEHVQLFELGTHKHLFQTKTQASHTHDPNPHIWLDPKRMLEMSKLVRDRLIRLNPDEKAYYRDNYHNLKDDLVTLDKQFKQTLDRKSQKEILVSHAAYSYWEERYGIKQIPIRGITSTDEPSQKALTSLMKQTKAHHLHYVLLEKNSSDRLATIIQNELDLKADYIHDLEVLTEDEINQHDDYLTLMKQNLAALDHVTK